LKIRCLEKPLPAALLLVLLWTSWRVAVLSRTGIPVPVGTDQFSYLLQADTFAHGRLANPPHPLAKFFESPHELMRPVYASKYPPGQAMFLALGQRLFGSPFYGVLIGNALMLFTTCLMLFAWVSPPWALAVSAMFALCLYPGMYWTNSYWGGSVAASGGALVLLSIGIYLKTQKAFTGAIFAAGILLLFWTRPYEGGVFALMVLVVFAKELWHKRQSTVLAVALSLLMAGAAWTCLDNKAITGSPFRLPYVEHDHQYNVTPVFWFLPLRSQPVYDNPRLAAMHGAKGWEASVYHEDGPWWSALARGLILSFRLMLTHIGLGVALMLVAPLAWHEPLFRKMAIVAGVFLLALGIETFHFTHYAAPVWAAIALMIAVWARSAWRWQVHGLPIGKALVVIAIMSPGVAALANTELIVHGLKPNDQPEWAHRRARLLEQFSKLPQRQLIIVRYPTSDWETGEEWVYNTSDIDQQRVIFAYDLGPEENLTLLHYYPDRCAWLLTFDPATGKQHVEPYRPCPQSDNNATASTRTGR
jgi:hypothetical protein